MKKTNTFDTPINRYQIRKTCQRDELCKPRRSSFHKLLRFELHLGCLFRRLNIPTCRNFSSIFSFGRLRLCDWSFQHGVQKALAREDRRAFFITALQSTDKFLNRSAVLTSLAGSPLPFAVATLSIPPS